MNNKEFQGFVKMFDEEKKKTLQDLKLLNSNCSLCTKKAQIVHTFHAPDASEIKVGLCENHSRLLSLLGTVCVIQHKLYEKEHFEHYISILKDYLQEAAR